MKIARVPSSAVFLFLCVTIGSTAWGAPRAFVDAKVAPSRFHFALDQLPLYFIENAGQVDRQVGYYVQGFDKTFYFTAQGVTLALEGRGGLSELAGFTSVAEDSTRPHTARERRRIALKLDFVGANSNSKPRGEEQASALVSYFKGRREDWTTGVKTYQKLVYRDLWPGIDLVYSGTVTRLKYMFVIKPGADPNLIKLAYRGAESVSVNDAGRLEVRTALGGFNDDKPTAYQPINGEDAEINVAYQLHPAADSESSAYGFRLGSYNRALPLIIDPAILVYAGFIGGSGTDRGNAIAVDAEGNAYITGETSSSANTFPDRAGPDLSFNGGVDAFVAKVNRAGKALIYAGYIGSSGDDRGNAIAIVPGCTSDCAVYIAGETALPPGGPPGRSFPVRTGPDLRHNGALDAFVAKLNAAGTALIYSGFIGGSVDDRATGLAVDAAGNAYVTGETSSTEITFPDGNGFGGVPGHDQTHNGGVDAFVVKLTVAGAGLVYATYIGGLGDDRGNGIAVDAAGNAYVTGETSSTEITFPDGNGFGGVPGHDQTHNGGVDAFAVKLTVAGAGLVYATYIGGSGDDRGNGIAVDGAGNAYLTGETTSTQATFPDGNGFGAVPGIDQTHNGGVDAFVAIFNSTGTMLMHANYIGGSGDDRGKGIALDETAAVYVTGETTSTQTTFPDGNGFGPVPGNDPTHNGGVDAFVAKICPNACVDLTVALTGTPDIVRVGENVTYTVAVTNKGPDDATNVELTVTLPSTVTLVSAMPDAGTCTSTVTLDCDLGNIAKGASPVLTTIVVKTSALGTLRTTANVTADQPDINPLNNRETETTEATLPNLVVRKLRAEKAVLPGGTITIEDTTTNRGDVAAEKMSVTGFFLSSDRRFDAGETPLGNREIPALAQKASSSGSITVPVDSSTALGRYFIIGVADVGNNVMETRENDRKFWVLRVTRPDLVITALRAPNKVAAGGSITITDTTKNKSPLPTSPTAMGGETMTKFYLSTDTVVDGGDIFLGSRMVKLLTAKGKSSDSTAVTISGGATPGKYFILAVADGDINVKTKPDGDVREADETNNTRARRITITP